MNKLSSNSCPTDGKWGFSSAAKRIFRNRDWLVAEESAKVFLVTQMHEKISEVDVKLFQHSQA